MFALLVRCRGILPVVACAICCLGGCTRTAAPPPERGTEAASAAGKERPLPAAPADGSVRKRPIARVLGTEIFEDDLAPPANADENQAPLTGEKLQKYCEARLQSLIRQPLMEKYCREHQLQPTSAEMQQYAAKVFGESSSPRDESLQDLRATLESGELSESDRRDALAAIALLEAEGPETYNERMISYVRSKLSEDDLGENERRELEESLQTMEAEQNRPEDQSLRPENVVRWWKFNRALYAESHGVVIIRDDLYPYPVEPVRAYRKWLEAHEQAGDFEIVDADARAAFWDYYKRDWAPTGLVLEDADPFGQPWWLRTAPLQTRPVLARRQSSRFGIALVALAIAFSAFCLWLTVRLVNRRERWARRTAVATAALLLLYPPSIGPASWMMVHWLPPSTRDVVDAFYSPIAFVNEHSQFATDVTFRYINLWVNLDDLDDLSKAETASVVPSE